MIMEYSKKYLAAIMLSIVLTIHSMFEGIVIGLAKNNLILLVLSGAIMCH